MLSVRSKTDTMHLGVFWPCNVVERVEGWRPKATDERTHKPGKPMGTMSVDDVDSTKLVETSEVRTVMKRSPQSFFEFHKASL